MIKKQYTRGRTEHWWSLSCGPLAGAYFPGRSAWLRLWGRGLRVRDNRSTKPFFSEREGYTRTLKIGPYVFKPLR